MAEQTDEQMAQTLGKGDKGSRSKAESAKERNQHEAEGWPTINGKPMVKIQMQASEIVPTGQYANVAIGPAVVTAFIDPEQPGGMDATHLENIAEAVNDLAQLVERDVVAVQRSLVQQSLQSQISQ
jgi:hypothetical protein